MKSAADGPLGCIGLLFYRVSYGANLTETAIVYQPLTNLEPPAITRSNAAETDPYQLNSLHNSPEHQALMEMLHPRLERLKVCSGQGSCEAAEDAARETPDGEEKKLEEQRAAAD